MKRITLLTLLLFPLLTLHAQTTIKYGYLSMDSLLRAMPEYAAAQTQLDTLRQKYEAEASYNERSFKQQFTDFLQGQKDFPQNILLKRQRDLQESMQRGIAFRHEADSLLRKAEKELLQPAKERLAKAVRAVGLERGYEYILNTDAAAYPFIHPSVAEDAAPFVSEKLKH